MKNRKIIIVNQSEDTLRIVGYFDCDVVIISVYQTETDKLVIYDGIRKCPPRTYAELIEILSY